MKYLIQATLLIFALTLHQVVLARTATSPSDSSNVWQRIVHDRPDVGDAMPSVIYDPTNPLKTWQMWWFGTLGPTRDIELAGLPAGIICQDDRIFYSYSANGVTWSSPEVVLRGQCGTGGYNAGDDHMVGSPSVIKVGATYYMYYEAYGTWMAPLNLFYNATHGDSWLIPEVNTVGDPARTRTGYQYSGTLGFAPRFQKHGTKPVYGGLTTYPNGQVNHFTFSQRTKDTPGALPQGYIPLNNGQPLFFLYDEPSPNRVPISTIWAGASWDTGVKNNNSAHPSLPVVELLGYAQKDLSNEEMRGVMQNKTHLATSTDGVHWERYRGPGTGGSVYAPENEFTSRFNPQAGALDTTDAVKRSSWLIEVNYGAGYPTATVRDGMVELFVPDESIRKKRLLRIDMGSQLSSSSWYSANRDVVDVTMELGGEVAWSPIHERYFISYVRQPNHLYPAHIPNAWTAANNGSFIQAPAVAQSFQYDLDATWPLETSAPLAATSGADESPPYNGNVALWGTFARTPLGQSLDFPEQGYTVFHHFPSVVSRRKISEIGSPQHHAHFTGIGHSVEFYWW